MSKKTLNKANLVTLGADKLADLLLEISTGSADAKRRLRLELAHNLGASELARDVAKRLATLRKSKGFVGWRKRKALVTDLNTQVAMICDKIAADDPTEAFDLLWQFMELAPFILRRCDDRRGDVREVFLTTLDRFEDLAPRARLDADALADRVWGAVSEDEAAVWDGVITATAPALGEAGLSRLKAHVEAFAAHPPAPEDDTHEAIQFLRSLRGERDYRAEQRQRFVRQCLQEIAAVSGDTMAYVEQFSPQDLQRKSVAAEVAQLLVADGQADRALAYLNIADDADPGPAGNVGQDAWDDAMIAVLTAQGHEDQAQDHRWSCFEQRLSLRHLRDYLKALPDFDDIEAEDGAKDYVRSYPDVLAAVQTCLHWPDPGLAAQIVLDRSDEIDGDDIAAATQVAEALRDRHPLAATLVLRAMIDHVVKHRRTFCYDDAARHLKDCEVLSTGIENFGDHLTHEDYISALYHIYNDDPRAGAWFYATQPG